MRYWINLCFLLAGTTLGILVCINVFGPCVTPLTDICKHTFWDWMLRVLEVFATISAVIVAVFKEEIRKKLFRPHISFNPNTELIENVAKMEGRCFATSYSAMMTLRNDGKNTATNLSVVIENIIYKRDVNSQTYQIINQEPLPMPILEEKRLLIYLQMMKYHLSYLSFLDHKIKLLEEKVTILPCPLL